MLDPRRLAVLRAFAAEGTVAAAAGALGYTPSAVSQQLSTLQAEVGVSLFRHVGRRLELTDEGHTLVRRAGELLAHVEEVEAELAARAGTVHGTVRVAAFQTASLALVVPAEERLAETHPELRVRLVDAEAEASLPDLERGRVDVVVAEEYEHAPRPRSPALHREYLEPDEMLLALPHGHEAARGEGDVELAALADSPWVTAGEDTAYSDMLVRICRTAGGFEPDIRHRASDMQVMLALVARGRAVAMVPALGQPETDGGVAVRRIAEKRFTRDVFAAVRAADRERPATGAVVEALREK